MDNFIKECEEHVHFCRNMNSHAWTNILITKLLSIIKSQALELKNVSKPTSKGKDVRYEKNQT